MPLVDKVPAIHTPGCWRWASHWRCTVALVEKLIGVLEQVADMRWDTDNDGVALGEAALLCEQVLIETGMREQ